MATLHFKVFVSVAALCVLILSFTGWVDDKGNEYAEEQIKVAAVTFAIARSLNAGISVAQGTEIMLSPAGLGTTLTVGEILDPVNDMIERFSFIVLAAITSLGIQQILIHVASTTLVNSLMLITTLACLTLSFKPRLLSEGARVILFKTWLLLIVCRFFIALSLLLNQAVYLASVEAKQSESLASLSTSAEDISALPATQITPKNQNNSFLNNMKNQFKNFQNSMSQALDLERLKDKASNAIDNMIDLIVAFVFLTLLLPIAFLWLGVKLVSTIIRYQPKPNV